MTGSPSDVPESLTASLMTQTIIVVVDMVGYNDVARILEENISPATVADLNRQIQTFVNLALGSLLPARYSVLSRTGDGIILLFEDSVEAHQFASNVHLRAQEHNQQKKETSAERWFRIGIASGALSRTTAYNERPEYAGTAIATSVRLEGAAKAGEIMVTIPFYDTLTAKEKICYGPEEVITGKRAERFVVRRYMVTPRPEVRIGRPGRVITRRALLGSGISLCGCITAAAFINRRTFERWLRPLPDKKFVAVLGWPAPSDSNLDPTITAVTDAIVSGLMRAEAFASNLLILSHAIDRNITNLNELDTLRESMGANLILAASVTSTRQALMLKLQLLEPLSGKSYRDRILLTQQNDQLTLPEMALRTAAELLDIVEYEHLAIHPRAQTSNPLAYSAFQAAQDDMTKPNDLNLDSAIANYSRALELDPSFAMANAELSWAFCRYFSLHKKREALLMAELNSKAAIAKDPYSVSGHLALASVAEYQGDRDAALNETQKALAIDPTNPRTFVLQAQLLTRCNRWTDAASAFNKVLSLRPNYWWAHNELGVLENSQGRYQDALNEFKAVTLLVPKRALGFNNVAAVYLQMGETQLASTTIQKGIALEPSGSSYVTLSQILRAELKFTEAIQAAAKATQMEPDDSSGWVELGEGYSLFGNRQAEAKEAFKHAAQLQKASLDTNPHDGSGWMTLAFLQMKLGMITDVPNLIQKAESNQSGDLDSQLYKARTLELLGDRVQSLDTVIRCMERGATTYQIALMPDMKELMKDRRFRERNQSSISTLF